MEREELLLNRLQNRDIKAFKDLIYTCSESLTNYASVSLKNPKRGRHLVDELLVKWQDEGFASATSPLSEWMIEQIDTACKREKQFV